MTPGMDRPPEVQRAIDTPRSQGNPDTALGYIYTRFIFQEFLQELKSAAVDSRSDIGTDWWLDSINLDDHNLRVLQ